MHSRRLVVAISLTALVSAFLSGIATRFIFNKSPNIWFGDRYKISSINRDESIVITSDHEGFATSFLDAKGTARIRAGITPEGNPVFGMFSENGKNRATITIEKDEPVVKFYGHDDKLRSSYKADEKGDPTIDFYGPNNSDKPLLSFGVKGTPSGDLPFIDILSEKNGSEMKAGIGPNAMPRILLLDQEKRTRIDIGMREDDEPYIHMIDKKGNVEWFAHNKTWKR